MVLKGRVVTADAIFCQRDLCQAVVKREGHYFIAVKENQPELLRDIRDAFDPPPDAAFSASESRPHRGAVLGMLYAAEAARSDRDPQAPGDHAPDRVSRLAGGRAGLLRRARG